MSIVKPSRTVPTRCFSWTCKLVVKKGLRRKSRNPLNPLTQNFELGWFARYTFVT